MAESEKLTALKKAYADIILNAAKEAASRILVSEKRALRYQRELFSTKDEAFRMLLRLKQMLDSQAGEANTTSLSQQRKIDELEAQLQEAEDIVKDLREELSEGHAQLERAVNNQAQPLDGQNIQGDGAAPDLILSKLNSQLDVIGAYEDNSISNGTYEGSECFSVNGAFRDTYLVQDPDFASIIMRRKEPELYRNGCTQRIRAFERNLLAEKLSLSGLVDDTRNATLIIEDDEGKRMSKKPKRADDNAHGVEKIQKMVTEESKLTGQESSSAQCLEVLTSKADVGIDNKPLEKSNTEASDLDDGAASRPVNNNFLKYTFCRKRKKETWRSPESKSLLDNGNLEGKAAEEQNGFLVPQNSTLLNESSRESKRLAQVARQLISLSEKKW